MNNWLNKVYLTDSKQWYLEESQARAYLEMMNKSYGAIMAGGEDSLLASAISIFIEDLPLRFTYVDLGPGNAVKSDFLISSLKRTKNIERYIGVDIQPLFLNLAKDKLEDHGIPLEMRVSSFEEFLSRRNENFPSLVYLGATYGNFESKQICSLLSNYLNRKDLIYLSCGLFPQDSDRLTETYRPSLELFKPIAAYKKISTTCPMATFDIALNQIELGFVEEDKFYVLGISKKPTEQQFRDNLSHYFTGKFFKNEGHIGFLGKTI